MTMTQDIYGNLDTFLQWEACRFPERRPDAQATFIRECHGCMIALRAAISAPPPPGEFDGFWRKRDQVLELIPDLMERAR